MSEKVNEYEGELVKSAGFFLPHALSEQCKNS
jgi:hypothetical protein